MDGRADRQTDRGKDEGLCKHALVNLVYYKSVFLPHLSFVLCELGHTTSKHHYDIVTKLSGKCLSSKG